MELGDGCRRCAAAAHRLLRALHPRIIHAPPSRRQKIRVEPSWPILLIGHLERAAGRNSEVRQVAKPNHVRHAASRQLVNLYTTHLHTTRRCFHLPLTTHRCFQFQQTSGR